MNNFFLKEDNCPITDIFSFTEQRSDYESYTEIKINNNLYLYYTNNFINGNLYTKNDLNNITNLPNKMFNFNEFNKEEKIKEEEVIDAIKELKYYVDYSDYICLSLFFISVLIMIFNLINYSNLYQIINIIIQIILFIFYLIRYIKFINLKNVFNKYKDFISLQYENSDTNEYFPNKYFNIDSFALALQINILIIIILYSEIFEGCFIKYEYLEKDIDKKIYIICSMLFCSVLLYTTIIYLIKLLGNLNKINYRVDNILNNWNNNPIKSIYLDENKKPNINWKNNSIVYEKLSDYNYKNIFYENRFKDSKICGKDSNNNNLYFPLDVECPINNIVITDKANFDTKGEYTKLFLKDNYFLYYTNKKINEKIIINLIITNHNGPELNFYESKEEEKLMDFDINSYSNIETFNGRNLLAIHYIGIDSNILSKTEKILNFDDKLKIYKNIIIAIESLLISFYGIMPLCLLIIRLKDGNFKDLYHYYKDEENKQYFLCFSIIFSIFSIPILILSSIGLSMNYIYVINFLNKINETYENNKVNFTWEMIIIIHIIIAIIFLISTIIYYFNENCFKKFKEIIFKCNFCECGECKTFKCDCDLGECECLKCLKNCGCDCKCICFKCSKDNFNNNHIPRLSSENIYINNTETLGEIQSLKRMMSNMITETNQSFNEVNNNFKEIKNNMNNQNGKKFLNDIPNNYNKTNDEIKNEISYIKKDIGNIKNDISNIKNLCNNCLEKLGNNNNDIKINKNEINKLQNEIIDMNDKFNGEITQLKNNAKYIGRLCEDCLEKITIINKIIVIDNDLKIIIKYENKFYQILINKDCTYKDFIYKIYQSISLPLNSNNIQLILYYWNQFGEKNKIKDDNDFSQALSLHIFYFEVINEKQNQIKQQNYISNEDN